MQRLAPVHAFRRVTDRQDERLADR